MAEPRSDDLDAPPASVRLGPIIIRADATEVAAFRREIGGDGDARDVPFTFPVRWFTHHDIQAAGAALIGPVPGLPIHESQSFDYARRLEIDIDYQMTVDIFRELDPSRLLLRAAIGPTAEDICLRAEMILRIVASGAPETRT